MSLSKELSAGKTPVSSRVRTSMPYVLLAIMRAAPFMLPQFAGRQASAFNVYDALQLWSAYRLVARGVGLTMIVGEFDFGVLGVFALCPMIAVKLGEYNLFGGFGAALALAALVGLLEGAIVAKLRPLHAGDARLLHRASRSEHRYPEFPERIVLEPRRGFGA
jgi:ribose/xylose/arabinose/galactoside ABC-type transport system permease subunit